MSGTRSTVLSSTLAEATLVPTVAHRLCPLPAAQVCGELPWLPGAHPGRGAVRPFPPAVPALRHAHSHGDGDKGGWVLGGGCEAGRECVTRWGRGDKRPECLPAHSATLVQICPKAQQLQCPTCDAGICVGMGSAQLAGWREAGSLAARALPLASMGWLAHGWESSFLNPG